MTDDKYLNISRKPCCMLLLLPWLLFSGSCFAQLVINGGFNNNVSQWDMYLNRNNAGAGVAGCNYISFTWDGSEGHNAPGSARIYNQQGRGMQNLYKWTGRFVEVVPESVYKVQAWIKCDGTRRAVMTLMLCTDQANGGSTDMIQTAAHASSGWSCITQYVYMPRDYDCLGLGVTAYGAGNLWVDDVTYERITALSEIADVMNLDFEASRPGTDIPQNWLCTTWPIGQSSLVRATDDTFSGAASLKFTLAGSDARAMALNYKLSMRLSATVIQSLNVKAKSDSGVNLKVRANYLRNDKFGGRVAIDEFTLTSQAANTWESFLCNLNQPVEADAITFEIIAEGQGSAWVDNIEFANATADITATRVRVPLLSDITVDPWPGDVLPASASPCTWQPIPLPAERTITEAINQTDGVHPKLVFYADKVEEFKYWAATTHQEFYNELMAGVKWGYGKNYGLGNRGHGDGAALFAFAYLLTENEAFLEEARQWALSLCDYHITEPPDLLSAQAMMNLALVYDWLFDVLNQTERDEIRIRMAAMADRWYDRISARMPDASEYRQNHTYALMGGLNMVAQVLGSENPLGGMPTSQLWAAKGEEVLMYVIEGMPDDGTDFEGLNYWSYGNGNIIRAYASYRHLTGTDIFVTYPWFETTGMYRLFHTMPGWVFNVPYGDDNVESYVRADFLLRIGSSLSSQYGGVYQWLGNKLFERWNIGHASVFDTHEEYEKRIWSFMFYNPAVDPISPQEAGLDPWHYFSDLESFVVRSDWTDDATMAAFKCGPAGGHKRSQWTDQTNHTVNFGHADVDAATFQIFSHGKHLAADPGYYYPKSQITQNTVIIGGHQQPNPTNVFVPYDRAANIPTQFACDAFSYVKGDASGAYYDAADLGKFHREMIGIEGKRYLLVDNIETNSPKSYTWIMNAVKDGQIIDDKTAIVENDGVKLKVVFLEPANINLSAETVIMEGSGVYVTGLPFCWPQMWRLSAQTASTTSERIVAALIPAGPGELLPSVTMMNQTVIFDDGHKRSEITLTDEGAEIVRWYKDALVSVGAVGSTNVIVNDQNYGDGIRLNWNTTVDSCDDFAKHPVGDFDGDCDIDLNDLQELAQTWLLKYME